MFLMTKLFVHANTYGHNNLLLLKNMYILLLKIINSNHFHDAITMHDISHPH